MANFILSETVWGWKTFKELSIEELYNILWLRQAAFVVEQDCPYFDIDGQDQAFLHLIGQFEDKLVGYLRLMPPQESNSPVYFGRVVVDKKYRGHGVAKILIQSALDYVDLHFPHCVTVISAQSYLEKFYNPFGFVKVGAPYDEDGIEHIAMRRNPRG
jgi:ElaA protein